MEQQNNRKKLYNIGVISLGCDKNRVDTEKMLFRIKMYGHSIVGDVRQADVVIINTCAFLNSSREESLNAVIESYGATEGKPIIVTGCLPQKYIKDIYENLTEAAGFLGTGDYPRILEAIEEVACGRRFNGVNTVAEPSEETGRVITTQSHYAFLMIADGCNNACSYCLIPSIRGRYRSFREEKILEEAQKLADGGVKELILVAQDVTRYGYDLYGEYSLVRLIKKLSQIGGLPDNSIRLMYCYPELVSDSLIKEIRDNPKVIKYIDMPMQHISDGILAAMKRRSNANSIKEKIRKLRGNIPQISIRSTFILGFPGETEEDFQELCAFLREYKLENVGFFAYSREKGTAASLLPKQIHYRIKQKRLKEANLIQQDIYLEENKKKLYSFAQIVCDGFDGEKGLYYGRTFGNAPLSDKLVYFSAGYAEAGGRYSVFIERADVYDIYGKVVN